ncbi:hypothetical protein ACRAWG_27420 [Methylobacterium sp. P31]
MRVAPKPIHTVLILLLMPAALPAEARPHPGRPHRTVSGTASDMDRTLAGMAARDRLRDWRVWEAPRPLAQVFAPATRERVAAPPFTGWGYGGTIPGARPGF